MAAAPLCRFRDIAVKLETNTQINEDWESYDLPMSHFPRKNQYGNKCYEVLLSEEDYIFAWFQRVEIIFEILPGAYIPLKCGLVRDQP